jgi:hypothetical protein
MKSEFLRSWRWKFTFSVVETHPIPGVGYREEIDPDKQSRFPLAYVKGRYDTPVSLLVSGKLVPIQILNSQPNMQQERYLAPVRMLIV